MSVILKLRFDDEARRTVARANGADGLAGRAEMLRHVWLALASVRSGMVKSLEGMGDELGRVDMRRQAGDRASSWAHDLEDQAR